MKKSFVIYLDQYEVVKKLDKEQKSILLDLLFLYNLGEQVDIKDPFIDLVFTVFKQTFDRDTDKWNRKAESNRVNGNKGGRPKNPKNPHGSNKTQDNPKKPKKAVSGSVSVNGSVNVNDNVSGSKDPFRNHLEMKINESSLIFFKAKIIEFYKYRMAMKKADQYQTEKGINGLIRNVLELQKSGLDVNDSLEYAMEKNWKSPELRYFNTADPRNGKKKTFDDFVNEGFKKNKEKIYVI